LTFIKNDEGEVTGVIHHLEWLADSVGKKLGHLNAEHSPDTPGKSQSVTSPKTH
jgi:hypothetical protein